MRLAIITQFYTPEPDPKMHALARGLVARGHDVSVLTTFPNWPLGRTYDGYRQSLWSIERVDGVRVVRLPVYPSHSRSRVGRAVTYLSFGAAAAVLGPFLSGPIDLVFVYHPPPTLALPALLLRILRRTRFVYGIQDLWPETLRATGMVRNSTILGAISRGCRLIYRWADALTIHSPGQRELLASAGATPEKIHFIPNWAYEGEFTPLAPDPGLARSLGLAERFNVVYAGNMGPAQGLETVLEAAALVDDPSIQFVFAGDGIERPRLERRTAQQDLRNVRFLGSLPQSQMPALYALADVLLLSLRNDPLFEATIPGKLQSYLAAGLPVLACAGRDAAGMVLSTGAGLAVRPSDPEDLARGVREIRAMPEDRRRAMGASGRRYYLAHLTADILIDRYEAVMQDVLSAT